MPGFPVVIVDEGGIPVVAVEENAPVATVSVPPDGEEPIGVAITIVEENGTPLIIEGYEP